MDSNPRRIPHCLLQPPANFYRYSKPGYLINSRSTDRRARDSAEGRGGKYPYNGDTPKSLDEFQKHMLRMSTKSNRKIQHKLREMDSGIPESQLPLP